MATKAATINRAAQFLGVLPLGQALPAHHDLRITQAFDEVYAQLKKDGLAVWASTDEVPAEIVRPVAALMADNCLDTYKVSADLFNRIKDACGPNGETARYVIRSYVTPAYVSTENPTDY
jgi:hypothetical protein